MENTGNIMCHFSHPHPLKLIVYKQTLNITYPCLGCKLKPSGMLYSCTICEYFLHKNCFEMPKKLTHPSHKQHPLALLSKPAYGEERFVCDACGEKGKGFSYHCKLCYIDLHMLCAIMPLSIICDSHVHKLNLTFDSEKKFSGDNICLSNICDICLSNIGSRQWVYRCKSCGFDCHLKCAATGGVRPPSQSPSPKAKEVVICSRLAPSAPELPLDIDRSENNEFAIEAVKQMIINNSTALAEAILSGRVCGDNRGLHMLMKLISDLYNNNTSISGTGGGSGSGRDVSNSAQTVIDNGGGSDQEYYFKASEIDGSGGGGGYLPEKITHRFDKKHDLTLQTKPAYSEGRFICDACGEKGKSYSYTCQPCGIDLHVSCAMMPFFVTHESHVHSLRLTFGSPYPNKKFTCGVCMGPGSRQWLYRCDSCGFDAHLKCAGGDVPPAHPPPSQPQEAAVWRPPPPPMMKNGFPEGQIPVNAPRPFGVDRQNNELAIQQMNINYNSRAKTTMAKGLMQLMSSAVNSGRGEEDQQSLFGDGNVIGILGGLFGG